ncbi:MAG: tyrosine-type recombinase/integrase, partial [Acidobacteriota bacterium]
KALGLVFRIDTYRLQAFLRHIGDADVEAIRTDQVQTFLQGKLGIVTPVWFSKFGALSRFFKYAISRGYLQYAPLPTSFPRKPDPMSPFLYTVAQIKSLLDVPDSAYHPSAHIRPHTMRAFLVLLYGTGLRPGEAMKLMRSDVDLDQAVLTVRNTKFFKSRLVPIGPELTRFLAAYEDKCPKGTLIASDQPFLRCRLGKHLKIDAVDSVFQWLRVEAHVLRLDGSGHQPRLYDFRHTFAVTRLVTWYRDGKDVQRLLPHLATYLGHVHIDHTAHYLTMTKELLKEASICFERYAMGEARHA